MTKFWTDEQVITAKEAGKLFPMPLSQATVYRIMDEPVNGHVLESFRNCSRRLTTIEAVERFIEATNSELAK